jgi:hypothetical protein
VSKSIKWNIKEVVQNACHRLQSKLQHDEKAKLDSECHCFDEFPELRFKFANWETPRWCARRRVVTGSQFREEFLLLQLKYDLIGSDQDRAYLFRNARNGEDAAQRLQRFVHWEVSFEETLHCRFTSSEYPRTSPPG